MTKLAQDIEIWEGEYKEVPFSVVDSASAAVNITGATLTWRMCANGPTGETLLSKASTDATKLAIVSAAAGTAKIILAESDTPSYGGDSYYHELVIEDSGGHSEVAWIGTITINKSAIL
jgi:hypothetical protein